MELQQNQNLLYNKGTMDKMKAQPTEWERIFANDTTHKVLVSKIYKQFIQLNIKKTNSPIKKHTKDLNKHYS